MSEAQKIGEIKQVVSEILARSDVQSHVRDALKQILDEDVGRKGVSEQAIIERLREEGVLHAVFEQIRSQIRDAKKELAAVDKRRSNTNVVSTPLYIKPEPAAKFEEVDNPSEIALLRERAREQLRDEGGQVRGDRRYLLVEIRGGRAFLEHIMEDEEELQGAARGESNLRLHVHYRGSRFVSRPVRSACEPRFHDLFIFDLGPAGESLSYPTPTGAGQSGGQFGSVFEQLIAIGSEPLHFVVTRHDGDGRAFLVASSTADWRDAVTAPRQTANCSVELRGAGPSESVAVGVLECRFSVLLGGDAGERRLLDMYASQSDSDQRDATPEKENEEVVAPRGNLRDALEAQRAFERSKRADADRLFVAYARKWWRELLQVRAGASERFVKLFARDETGASRFACTYVRALRAARVLDSPRAAARFVSVVPFERGGDTFATGTSPESDGDSVWLSAHAFLAANRGDSANHAVLLCSLLLGFGLEAYVALGTKARRQPHAWVVTVDRESDKVTFWESVTGFRYVHTTRSLTEWTTQQQETLAYPYRTVGCLFNDRKFFANVQSTDSVAFVAFDLANEAHWKAINEQAIASLTQLHNVSAASGSGTPDWLNTRANSVGWFLNAPVPLLASTIEPARESDFFETEFAHLVMLHRRDRGLATSWDEQLSYMMTQAISTYELERLSGVEGAALGIDEFQQSVRTYIPEGHTFKAFPIQFVHRNPRRAFQTCLKSAVFCDVLECRGDQVRLAIRARIYPYAEQACATWLIVSCKYKSLM